MRRKRIALALFFFDLLICCAFNGSAAEPIEIRKPNSSKLWVLAVSNYQTRNAWSLVAVDSIENPHAPLEPPEAIAKLEFYYRNRLLVGTRDIASAKVPRFGSHLKSSSTIELTEQIAALIREATKKELSLVVIPPASIIFSTDKDHYVENGNLAIAERTKVTVETFLEFTKRSVQRAIRYQRDALKNEAFEKAPILDQKQITIETAESVWKAILTRGLMLPCKRVYLSRKLTVLFVEFDEDISLGDTIAPILDGSFLGE